MIKRIHVRYHLTVAEDVSRETIDHVHQIHKQGCPVYRSIEKAIEITTEVSLGPE